MRSKIIWCRDEKIKMKKMAEELGALVEVLGKAVRKELEKKKSVQLAAGWPSYAASAKAGLNQEWE